MKNVRNTYSFRRYAAQNSAAALHLRPRRVADTPSGLPRHQPSRCLSAVTPYRDRTNTTYVSSNSFAIYTTSRRREGWCVGLSLILATNFARIALCTILVRGMLGDQNFRRVHTKNPRLSEDYESLKCHTVTCKTNRGIEVRSRKKIVYGDDMIRQGQLDYATPGIFGIPNRFV